MNPLSRAIQIAGSQSELARKIGGNVKTGHIYYWLKNGVPVERAVQIEAAVNGAVSRRDIRPDFPWDTFPVGSRY